MKKFVSVVVLLAIICSSFAFSTVVFANEYDMPDMLGWTAGVYLVCTEYLKEKL